MRLDLVLHRLCLFKTRTQAGSACNEARVRVNGEIAKPARTVRAGDRIAYRDSGQRFEREIEVLELPDRQVSKTRARELYRVLGERELEQPWEGGPR